MDGCLVNPCGPALEPLLERVNKPIQYVGGELNSTVKDWNVGGTVPPARS